MEVTCSGNLPHNQNRNPPPFRIKNILPKVHTWIPLKSIWLKDLLKVKQALKCFLEVYMDLKLPNEKGGDKYRNWAS